MLRLNHRLGNLHTNPELRSQIERWQAAGVWEETTIDERDARKSRHRLYTNKGRELALILPRGSELQDGDIFTSRRRRR